MNHKAYTPYLFTLLFPLLVYGVAQWGFSIFLPEGGILIHLAVLLGVALLSVLSAVLLLKNKYKTLDGAKKHIYQLSQGNLHSLNNGGKQDLKTNYGDLTDVLPNY